MSTELASVLIAIVAVGAALGGLMVTSIRGLRQDMVRLESRMREDINQLREDMKQLSDCLARVEHSQAKLEGLLEGLREAITGRAAAS